jgi:hypothetical protein
MEKVLWGTAGIPEIERKNPLYNFNGPRIVCAGVQFWGGLLRRPLSRVNPGSGRYHLGKTSAD